MNDISFMDAVVRPVLFWTVSVLLLGAVVHDYSQLHPQVLDGLNPQVSDGQPAMNVQPQAINQTEYLAAKIRGTCNPSIGCHPSKNASEWYLEWNFHNGSLAIDECNWDTNECNFLEWAYWRQEGRPFPQQPANTN